MNFTSQFLSERRVAFIAVAVGATSLTVWYYASNWLRLKKLRSILDKEWEEVGHISQLVIYPIKSAKGISVQTAMASEFGLKNGNLADRSFVVFTEELTMVTGRDAYKLVTMATSFKDDKLTITILEGDKVTVSIHDIVAKNKNIIRMKIRGDYVQGIDCGDSVAEWLSKHLYEDGTRVRLLYAGLKEWTRKKRDLPFDFPGYGKNDSTVYNDATAYMVMADSSLQDLNSKISSTVSMAFFRPPIVVSGSTPFDEDTWEQIKIGDNVVFHVSKPCERCLLTKVDPESGNLKEEHFDALLRYRTPKHPPELAKLWKTRPVFGQHCGIDITGKISVGDKVYVSRIKSPYWHV